MQVNMRREPRSSSHKTYSISWQDANGFTRSAQVEGVDFTPSGIGIRSPVAIQAGCSLYIQGRDGKPAGNSTVRHCYPAGDDFVVGLELDEETKKTNLAPATEVRDYYSFLQISPRAEPETIHRVYRFLATRFHPDNPETGDPERFLLLKGAYEILSDPKQRAAYDATLQDRELKPVAAFGAIDFLDGIEGEVNRRLAVLSILYHRRRVNTDHPHVSLAELEMTMGFPREYLDFTTWYLKGKKLITREDNSDFALTALGVDYIEANYSTTPMLRKLLAGVGSADAEEPTVDAGKHAAGDIFILGPGSHGAAAGSKPS